MHNPLLQVKGVGPAPAEHLAAAGITTIEALAAATVEQLTGFPGFGQWRARQVIAQAQALLADAADGATNDAAAFPAVPETAAKTRPPELEDSKQANKEKQPNKEKKAKKEKRDKKKSKKKKSEKTKGKTATVKKEGGKKKKAKKKKK